MNGSPRTTAKGGTSLSGAKDVVRRHATPFVPQGVALTVAASAWLLAAVTSVAAASKPVMWHAPNAAELRAQVQSWLEQSKADGPTRAKVLKLWPEAASPDRDVLSRLAESFAVADPRAAELVALCVKPHPLGPLAAQTWLSDPRTPSFVARNLHLYYGRWLVQESLIDEAAEQLIALAPADVADPASLLFYQAVVHHRLLEREQGLLDIAQLLGGQQGQSPARYAAVARLMQQDLQGLKEETLDHIARRMDDVHRRLDLGRAGPKVRKVEDGVIESLDKMIKKLEDAEQQQMSSAGTMHPSKPAEESRPMGGKGPGEVVKRNVGSKSGWGNLPPKEREQAIQQIGRDFPPHYREIIEQYFRKLASEGSE